jgi:single-strand DNA-binding protein
MAFSLNKIMLIGNLGKDAETRFTTSNLSVTTFTMATTNSYKGKDGNWINETTWHNIVAYNLSDYFKESLKKGKKFYVEGRLAKKEYTDKEGIKRWSTEVVLDKVIPLESTGSSSFSEGGSFREESSSPGVQEANLQVDENEDLPF